MSQLPAWHSWKRGTVPITDKIVGTLVPNRMDIWPGAHSQ